MWSRTTHAVWELTLKCNLACSHCGSRAGDAREDELDTAEALELVGQLADAGIKEVTLIGGEAFLRKDWLIIAGEIVRRGMRCSTTTGGYGINAEQARRMRDAGISVVSVSIDGMALSHDRLRGRLGSWAACFATLEHLQDAGISIAANTQFNRRTAPDIALLYEALSRAAVIAWQIQLTVPMGNAADDEKLLLQPYELPELYPLIAYLARRGVEDGLEIQPGNNIGYYGPYERLLRGRGRADTFWEGCQAGLSVLGIEADGAIKGCPSLPTAKYTGGNIREHRLADIVEQAPELAFNEHQGTERATEHLWGFCSGCEFAEVCRGGCTWTSHVFFDRRGNNPYCHHRALVHAAKGTREVLVQEERASGRPFDNGRFGVRELPAPEVAEVHEFTLDSVRWPSGWLEEDPALLDRLRMERDETIALYANELPDLDQTSTSTPDR